MIHLDGTHLCFVFVNASPDGLLVSWFQVMWLCTYSFRNSGNSTTWKNSMPMQLLSSCHSKTNRHSEAGNDTHAAFSLSKSEKEMVSNKLFHRKLGIWSLAFGSLMQRARKSAYYNSLRGPIACFKMIYLFSVMIASGPEKSIWFKLIILYHYHDSPF